MNKNFNKFLISIFAVSVLTFGVFHNNAAAGFWDWINLNKANNTSQQQQAAAIANAETTYKWVNNGLVSESEGRYTGSCGIESTTSNDYICNSSTKGNKLYDGTDRGSSYGDTGHAWPIYKGENTSTAKKYNYDSSSCGLTKRTGGTVNEWECKSSGSSTNSSSSSSSSSSSTSANHTASTGSADNVTSTSATLNGTVNPNGEETYYLFAYRKNSDSSSATKYAPSNKWVSVGSGSSDVSVTADISGLSSGTKYVYKLYAYSSATKKTVNGDLKSFTTSGSSSTNSSSSVSSGASSSSSSSAQQYTLKVKISGAGKITSSGGSGIVNCKKSIDSKGQGETSGDCTVKFNKGESVTLTPSTPSSQYEFATWAEACRGSQKLSSCTIIMNGNKTVSATFNKKSGSSENTATVSVRKTGKGSGKVISINYKGSAMAGINCGNDCSENFKQLCETSATRDGTCGTVYFKATADKGSTFGGWGGDCLTFKNEKNQCYVNLEGDKTITASFNEGSDNTEGKYFDLTVTVSEGGTVATTDSKISCDSSNSPCKHSYGKNGTITLKATPNSGYSFKDANIICSGSNNRDKGIRTCKVKMTKNQDVKINFKASGTTSSSSSSKSSSSSSASANHTATTGSATDITSTSATLNGTVNPKGEKTYYLFAYRKNSDSSSATKYAPSNNWKLAGSDSSDISVTADISGLSSGTKYVYRLYAYSSATKKTVNGELKSFTTSDGSSSSSSSSSSSQTTASSYKLKLTISGNGRVQDTYSKIDCTSNMSCEATYSKGQVITLKTEERDSEGDIFGTKVNSWSGGGCNGTSNSCQVTMDGDKEITIKFVDIL